jgi:hypothetical protein
MIQLSDWLQHNSLIIALNSSAWTAAPLEVLHYFSMFILVGSIAVVDLRVLGLAGRGQSVTSLAERLFPWMWLGLALNFLTGFLMFGVNATAYVTDPIFHAKMTVTLAAVVFGLIVQWNVPRWDKTVHIPLLAKVVAVVSLLLWVGAILAGVEVPALSGIG